MPLRRFTAAELILTQRLHLEGPLLVLVLLGAAALALAEEKAFYLALTVGGVLVNALALQRRSEVYVPRLLVNLAVLLATVVFLFDFIGPSDVLTALGHYLVLIQLCKLFEQKRNRDYVQMIAISVMLVVASAMISAGMWFAVVLTAYVPVALYVAMVLTLKVALDRQASARLAREPGPMDPHRLAWNISGPFPRRALWHLTLRTSAGALLAGVVVFLLMPRVQAGMLARLESKTAGASLTGFAESIGLRDVGRISADRRILMRVGISSDGREVDPQTFPAYLRGRVYDEYRDGRWQTYAGELGWWSAAVPTNRPLPEGKLLVQRVVMDSSLLPALFALAPTLWVELPSGVVMTGSYPNLVAGRVGTEGSVRYTAVSWAQPLTAPQRTYLAQTRGHGPGNGRGQVVWPALADLAGSWCADLLARRRALSASPDRPTAAGEPDRSGRESTGAIWPGLVGPQYSSIPSRTDQLDLAIAERIAQRLTRDYSYTLNLPQVDDRADPVEEFLLRTRRGHCEYFASAMTLLCRTQGVQARLAGGFLSTDPAPGGGYLVRARDAHAWCEVYTPSTDWVIFDPTPPGALQRTASPLANLYESIRFFWNTRVIGYGEEDRQGLFGSLLAGFAFAWRSLTRWCVSFVRALVGLVTAGEVSSDLVKGVAAVALGLAAAAMLGLLAGWGRKRAPPPAVLAAEAPAFYRRLLKLLRRRGLRPRASQTPREFLSQAEGTFGLRPGTLASVATLLYQVRWGHLPLSPADLRLSERIVNELAGLTKGKKRR